MTTELTKAAQQALEALKETLLFCETFSNRWDGETGAHPFGMVERARAAVPILTRALTQRPAANPTAQELESAAKICDGSAAPELAAALRGQRPAAQTEREADGLPLIVAGAIFDFAGFMTTRAEVIEVGSTAEAGPVADLVKEWAELRGLDLADAAVLSWQLHITRASLPAPQQATPEPVGDVRCEGCGYMTHHREHMGCVRAAKQHTRPAPGVPEGLQWFTVAERGMPDFDEEVIAGLWYTDPCLKPEFATRFMWGLCRVFKDDYRDFKDGKRWHTFGPSHNQITHWARFNWPALAAQAKGDDK